MLWLLDGEEGILILFLMNLIWRLMGVAVVGAGANATGAARLGAFLDLGGNEMYPSHVRPVYMHLLHSGFPSALVESVAIYFFGVRYPDRQISRPDSEQDFHSICRR